MDNPHVYAIADTAYTEMMRGGENPCVFLYEEKKWNISIPFCPCVNFFSSPFFLLYFILQMK